MGLTKEQLKNAHKLNSRGLIVMPAKLKRPWFRGWQQLTKSVDDPVKWSMATCFSILTGKKSKVTVIDVDAPDREWFDEYWKKLALPPTTTVETPSGGLHLYYKYDERLKQTQGIGGLAIDVRNDGGQVVAPGSPYDTEKQEKKKFNGIEYKMTIGWDKLRPLDEVWVQIQERGVDKKTMELKPVDVIVPVRKPSKKTKKSPKYAFLDDGEIRREPRKIPAKEFMKLMLQYSKHNTGYDAWYKGVWAWCQVAQDNKFDAFKWADKWSQQIEGYDGADKVAAKVEEYEKVSNTFDYDFILNQLPAKTKCNTAQKFLTKTAKKYYYLDYKKLMDARHPKTKLLDVRMVDDYLRTALFAINRNGRFIYYLRHRTATGQDKFGMCENKQGPFAAALMEGCPFTLLGEPTDEEKKLANKEDRKPRPEIIKSSIRQRYKTIFHDLEQYSAMVFRQYYGKPSPVLYGEYNLFTGYKAKEIDMDEKLPEEVHQGLAVVEDCWLTMMCNGNRELYEYVLNWQAWLIRHGHNKIETFLVFIGKQGTGKNTLWEKFFLTGILGRYNGHVVTDLNRFLAKFNMERLYKALHIFNECTSQLGKKKHDSDKLKALTDKHVTIEPKGKERFKAEDTAGCIFLSNHTNPVKLGNSDRRHVVTDMGEKYIGNTEYWIRLNKIITDQRVCNLYFTKLMQRDVENWNQRDIPKTERRKKLKEANWENHFIHFLVEVARGTDERWGEWYDPEIPKRNGQKYCYFKKTRVMDYFKRYADQHNLNWQYFNLQHMMDIMTVTEKHSGPRSSPKLRCTRVLPRGPLVDRHREKKPVNCLLIDKEEIRQLYRYILNEPEWEFPAEEDVEPRPEENPIVSFK